MSQSATKARGIQAGYEWRLRVTVSGAGDFPEGARFKAQARRSGDLLVANLSTEEGTIIRQGIDAFDLIIPGEVSRGWPPLPVLIDVVRTDLTAHQHLGFRITVPVVIPITREE